MVGAFMDPDLHNDIRRHLLARCYADVVLWDARLEARGGWRPRSVPWLKPAMRRGDISFFTVDHGSPPPPWQEQIYQSELNASMLKCRGREQLDYGDPAGAVASFRGVFHMRPGDREIPGLLRRAEKALAGRQSAAGGSR